MNIMKSVDWTSSEHHWNAHENGELVKSLSERDWAELPDDALQIILEKSKSCIEYLGFRMVCNSWHRVMVDREIRPLTDHQIPVLLVPGKKRSVWRVYNPVQNKFMESLKVRVSHCVSFSGSSAGWLVAMNKDYTVTLHKPYFGVGRFGHNKTISLPCLFSEYSEDSLDLRGDNDQRAWVVYKQEFHVIKMIVTADPVLNPEECIIAAIVGDRRKLAFSRYAVKDTTPWTVIDLGVEWVSFQDLVYYKNRIYAVTYLNKVICFDPLSGDPVVTIVSHGGLENLPLVTRYLVKTPKGELWQVVRYKNYGDDKICLTVSFDVWRLYMSESESESYWTKVESLGDMSIFLGDNTSIAVRASDFHGCRPDYIYFTHSKDSLGLTHHFGDLGIYEVGTKRFEKYFNIDSYTLYRMPRRPLWILPTKN